MNILLNQKILNKVLYIHYTHLRYKNFIKNVIEFLQKGDMFGDFGFFSGYNRSAGVKTKSVVYLAFLDKEDFN